MDIPLELAFHNMTPSDGLKAAVRQQIERLERIYDHIIGCRVVIEMPHKSHRLRSNLPDVHLVVRVPGRELVVSRELAHAGSKKSPADAYAVLHDAFHAMQQSLKDYRRVRQGEVKRHRVAQVIAPQELGGE